MIEGALLIHFAINCEKLYGRLRIGPATLDLDFKSGGLTHTVSQVSKSSSHFTTIAFCIINECDAVIYTDELTLSK